MRKKCDDVTLYLDLSPSITWGNTIILCAINLHSDGQSIKGRTASVAQIEQIDEIIRTKEKIFFEEV